MDSVPIRLIMVGIMWATWAAQAAAPGFGDALKLTRGMVRTVSTVPELKMALKAVNRAGIPATILLEDGTYVLDIPTLHILCPGLVVRSVSGNRDAVIVRGPDEGPKASLKHVFLVPVSDVVIADITLGWCRYHGIQIQGESPHDASGLLVHNCRLVNCNEQFIKGSAGSDLAGASDCVVEQCLFEFTSGWAYQYYTGGIDIHKGVNWIVRDNLFRHLRLPAGQPGMTEHAVHFWNRAGQPQNVVVERNWIINCDRGIGFGLGSFASGFHGGNSAIRNNFIFNDGTGPVTDVAIGLENAHDVMVDNNTVYVSNYWSSIEYRFAGSSNIVLRNNLLNIPIRNRDNAPQAVLSHNIENARRGWFRDMSSGDLHLAPAAVEAIGGGVALEKFQDDIDRGKRPGAVGWDVGADQYDGAKQ